MNDFQDRLQELLTENNLSRLQLSKIIGISSTTINGYFNNDYYPQIDIAIKMAKHFNCSLDYLFGFSDYKINTNKNQHSFIDNFDALLQETKTPISRALRDMKMSEYNYYRWKNGQFPKTHNLLDIVKYFDTSLDFLIGNYK